MRSSAPGSTVGSEEERAAVAAEGGGGSALPPPLFGGRRGRRKGRKRCRGRRERTRRVRRNCDESQAVGVVRGEISDVVVAWRVADAGQGGWKADGGILV